MLAEEDEEKSLKSETRAAVSAAATALHVAANDAPGRPFPLVMNTYLHAKDT